MNYVMLKGLDTRGRYAIFLFFFARATSLVTSYLLYCTPNPSEMSTLKGKELLPRGATSFLYY